MLILPGTLKPLSHPLMLQSGTHGSPLVFCFPSAERGSWVIDASGVCCVLMRAVHIRDAREAELPM